MFLVIYWLIYLTAGLCNCFYRSLILLISSLKNGVRTSQAQFFFYATALFCGAFTLRSMVQRIDKAEYDQDESNRLLFFYAIQYGLYVIMFFLNCFADAEPKVIIIYVMQVVHQIHQWLFWKYRFSWNFLTNQIVLMTKQQQRNKIRFILI